MRQIKVKETNTNAIIRFPTTTKTKLFICTAVNHKSRPLKNFKFTNRCAKQSCSISRKAANCTTAQCTRQCTAFDVHRIVSGFKCSVEQPADLHIKT